MNATQPDIKTPPIARGPVFSTYTGRLFYPGDPRATEVDLDDIAHHLSMINRFGGALTMPYSVAQHSVLVSRIAPNHLQKYALMHDAAEAYLGDIVAPVKDLMGDTYRKIEDRVMRAISERFNLRMDNLSQYDWDTLKACDIIVALTEKRDLLPNAPRWRCEPHLVPMQKTIVPMTPQAAERLFLQRFEECL